MEFNLLGDCFSYGLSHELVDEERVTWTHMKTAFVYLWLKGYVEIDTLQIVKKNLICSDAKERAEEAFSWRFLAPIVRDLKRLKKFEDYDSLIEVLNQDKIPQWMFRNVERLYDLFPQAVLFDDALYYISKCDDLSSLVVIRDVSAHPRLCLDRDEVVIADEVGEMAGIDRQLGILYAKMLYFPDRYMEYNFKTGEIHIYHMKLEQVVGGVIPLLINENDELHLKFGDSFVFLKKLEKKETYKAMSNYLRLLPKEDKPVMFKPYRVCFDGTVEEETPAICKDYMVDLLMDEMCSEADKMIRMLSKKIDDLVGDVKEYEDIPLMTLSEFKKLMDLDDVDEEKKKLVTLIVKILSNYICEDTDILDLLYIFAEYARRREENVRSEILSKFLFWRLQELHVTGVLGDYIRDAGKLREKLLENIYWDDQKVESLLQNDNTELILGRFEFRDGKLQTELVDSIDCSTLGCFIIPLSSKLGYNGIVAYDTRTDTTEIHYGRQLTSDEIEDLKSRFQVQHFMNIRLVIEEIVSNDV